MIINPEKISKCSDQIKNLVAYLERIYGTVIVTSGYRTPEENSAAGGAQDSAHLKGLAVDLIVKDVHCVKIAAKALEGVRGIKGFGIDVFQNYVHLDFMDRGSNLVSWCYDRQGKYI